MPEIELTNKQSIVLDKWLGGETQRSISEGMGISPQAINIMLKSIAKKFDPNDWRTISKRKMMFSYEING